jgi:hypothetical protein
MRQIWLRHDCPGPAPRSTRAVDLGWTLPPARQRTRRRHRMR